MLRSNGPGPAGRKPKERLILLISEWCCIANPSSGERRATDREILGPPAPMWVAWSLMSTLSYQDWDSQEPIFAAARCLCVCVCIQHANPACAEDAQPGYAVRNPLDRVTQHLLLLHVNFGVEEATSFLG